VRALADPSEAHRSRRPSGRPLTGLASAVRAPHGLLALQRSAGNGAVQHLVAAAAVQRSCCAGCASGGPCAEQEAAPAAARDAVERAEGDVTP